MVAIRSPLLLLAVLHVHLASAAWYPSLTQTARSTFDGENGWTPRPTDGPELVRGRKNWALLGRQTEADGNTCGWFYLTECAFFSVFCFSFFLLFFFILLFFLPSPLSRRGPTNQAPETASPFTCGPSLTCVTNTQKGVVACSSSGLDVGFYTTCVNYLASKAGKCDNIGTDIQCCRRSTLAECVTYIWDYTRLYTCGPNATAYTMLETPWYSTTTTNKAISSSSSLSITSSAPAQSASESPPPAGGVGGINTAAIAAGLGGFIGGVLIASAVFVMILARKKKKGGGDGTGSSGDSRHPHDPYDSTKLAYPGHDQQPVGELDAVAGHPNRPIELAHPTGDGC